MGVREQTEAQLRQNEPMRRNAKRFGAEKIGPESNSAQVATDEDSDPDEARRGNGGEPDDRGIADTGRDATRGAKPR